MTVNTLGGDAQPGVPRSTAWLWPLLPIAVATFALSALVSHQMRAEDPTSVLQHAIVGIYRFVGFVPAFFFFLLVLSWSTIWFFTGVLERPASRLARLLGLTLALAIWVNLRPEGSEAQAASGTLGSFIGARMVSVLGHFLSVVLVAPLALAALLLATDFFFYRHFEGLGSRLDALGSGTGDGVESDVTEHFKGLSQVLNAPVAARGAPAALGAAPRVAPAPARPEGGPARRAADALAADAGDPDADRRDADADAADADDAPVAVEAGGVAKDGAGDDVEDADDADDAEDAEDVEDVESSEHDRTGAAADGDDEFSIAAAVIDAGSGEPQRGRLAPIAADAGPDATEADALPEGGSSGPGEPPAAADLIPMPERTAASAAGPPAAAEHAGEGADEPVESPAAATDEPVVAIPRPPDGVRQQRLFVTTVDEGLVREAIEIVTNAGRASATLLQRKLRIDYEHAMELLAVLSRRGVIELAEGESQGRVR